MAATFVFSQCPSCGSSNRIPVSRLASGARCGSCKTAIPAGEWRSDQPVSIGDESFTDLVQRSRRPVLVDFWAPWCGPCRLVAPVLEQLARRYSDELLIVKINVDENPLAAQAMEISSIPSLVLFRGGSVLDRVAGALPAHRMEAWINKALGLSATRH